MQGETRLAQQQHLRREVSCAISRSLEATTLPRAHSCCWASSRSCPRSCWFSWDRRAAFPGVAFCAPRMPEALDWAVCKPSACTR